MAAAMPAARPAADNIQERRTMNHDSERSDVVPATRGGATIQLWQTPSRVLPAYPTVAVIRAASRLRQGRAQGRSPAIGGVTVFLDGSKVTYLADADRAADQISAAKGVLLRTLQRVSAAGFEAATSTGGGWEGRTTFASPGGAPRRRSSRQPEGRQRIGLHGGHQRCACPPGRSTLTASRSALARSSSPWMLAKAWLLTTTSYEFDRTGRSGRRPRRTRLGH